MIQISRRNSKITFFIVYTLISHDIENKRSSSCYRLTKMCKNKEILPTLALFTSTLTLNLHPHCTQTPKHFYTLYTKTSFQLSLLNTIAHPHSSMQVMYVESTHQ